MPRRPHTFTKCYTGAGTLAFVTKCEQQRPRPIDEPGLRRLRGEESEQQLTQIEEPHFKHLKEEESEQRPMRIGYHVTFGETTKPDRAEKLSASR